MLPARPPQSRPPLIGVTLDILPGDARAYSRYTHHAIRENYLSAVSHAGGLPVCPGYDADPDALMDRLDALIVTGGAFDVDPALYGEDPHPLTTLKPARGAAECALLRAALARDKPVLGICGGMQLLAVVAGGTLIQHLPPELGHEQPNPRHEAGHTVEILPGTRLAHIVGASRMRVNSSHHQAVRTPGRATVSARAPMDVSGGGSKDGSGDESGGVIEAIELEDAKFALGVQWHPEFTLDPGDRRLYSALVEAAR